MYLRHLGTLVTLLPVSHRPLWPGEPRAGCVLPGRTSHAPAEEGSSFLWSADYVSPDDAHSFKIKNRKHSHCSGEFNRVCSTLPLDPSQGLISPWPGAAGAPQAPSHEQDSRGARGQPQPLALDWDEPRLGQDLTRGLGLGSGLLGERGSDAAVGWLGRAVGMGLSWGQAGHGS